jgi:bifunctional DNase/RNase
MKAERRMVTIGEISLRSDYTLGHGVLLSEHAESERQLTLYVGAGEFVAIAKEKGLAESKRPLTHETYLGILEKLDIDFLRVEIFAMRENTYYAKIVFRRLGEEHMIDSRPSDAIALALNRKIPVLVNEDLLRPVVSEADVKEYQTFIKQAQFKPE